MQYLWQDFWLGYPFNLFFLFTVLWPFMYTKPLLVQNILIMKGCILIKLYMLVYDQILFEIYDDFLPL